MFDLGEGDAAARAPAARALRRRTALDLLDHKDADLRGRGASRATDELEQLARFRRLVEQERASPHRLRDLAVDGTDLIGIGYDPGPRLGHTLRDAPRTRSSTPALEHGGAAARAGEGALAVRSRWDAPGPYVVAFTTRVGGVSDGVYAVAQPRRADRRRPGAGRGEPPPRLRGARRSTPSGSRSTGRCTRRPCTARAPARAASPATGSGPTSRTCRCSRSPPTACRSRSRARTARARRSRSLHAGWRGLRAGVVDARRRGARRRAEVAPSIGPGDRAVLLRGRRRGRPSALRRRPDARRDARPVDRRRAGARARRRRARRPARPLHALPPRAVLLAPARRRARAASRG